MKDQYSLNTYDVAGIALPVLSTATYLIIQDFSFWLENSNDYVKATELASA